MHRIVPDFIIENYKAGRPRGAFRAAAMFLDISGFSTLTDALMGQGRDGAEALAVTMRSVFDPIVEAIFEHGGMIAGYAGDSITALYPVGDNAAQAAPDALAAAWSIQQGLRVQPFFETPYGGFHISAKIGLSMGTVSWGILPSQKGDKAVYYFRGDAVERAALAEHQACPGDIVLTDEIASHVGTNVGTRPVADFHLLLRPPSKLLAPRTINLPSVDSVIAGIFVPGDVVTRDLQGEFRQTVPLLLHVPNLTDEELQQFIDEFFDLQARYGGMVDRIDFGDKGCTLIVLWGAPTAHENDIDRALSFVLELRSRLCLPVTAGIAYYTSYAGYVGGRLFESYTAYGWGVNLAARFMMGAPENEIWLDERTAQRAGQRFQMDYVGEQLFKGFARKQKVYVLRGHKAGTEPLFHGKMANRNNELQALADFVDPLWQGKFAGIAGIWGEAGMGKSRLVYEFRHSDTLQKHGCLWALCQSDEIQQRSFAPFEYWLFKYFDVLPTQDRAACSQRFAAKLDQLIASTGQGSLADELRRARWFLAALLQLEWPDALYEQLDPQSRYDNTILALIALVKAESLRQPVILFLEDAQYLDNDSKAFLARLKHTLLADRISYPIAILMAARWRGTRVLLEDGLVDQQFTLSGLSASSISTLCEDILGSAADPALVCVVNERAEGNPFFADQTLRYLQEQDLIEHEPCGEWCMKPSTVPSVLPSDASAMLVARLDSLPGVVKEAIQVASVLGRVFDVPVLQKMLPQERFLQNRIAAAEHAGIWSPLSETGYIFSHALVRDVAYRMQLQSRRRELHAVAFHALSEYFGNRVCQHYAELAYHGEQGGLSIDALRCLSLAGDAARDQYQNVQALDFYRRALQFVPATDLHEQYRLHRECEHILAESGGTDERSQEISTLESLADIMDEPGNCAEVMWLRARLLASSGSYEAAARLATQAKNLALHGGRTDLAIDASLTLLDTFYTRGMYKNAIDEGEAIMALARREGAHQKQGEILNLLGLAVLEMKNPAEARAYFEQARDIFRAHSCVRDVANVLGNLGLVAAYQGNYNIALEYYEQSLRLMREIGSRKGETPRLTNLGWICGMLGDYPKAQTYAAQALQIAREMGDFESETFSLINLSANAGAMGESTAAIDYAGQALSLARQSHDRNAQAWALTYLGHALLESGIHDQAGDAYRDALDLRYQLDQPALATEPAAGLAQILLLQGDHASERDYVDTILAQLEQDGTLEGTDQPLRVYLSCYLVLSSLHDSRANPLLNTARDMLRTRANAISDPEARKAFLENVPYNREILSLWNRYHGN